MRYVNIFRIYNLKRLKKDKFIFIFTALLTLMNSCISLVIPQIREYINVEFIYLVILSTVTYGISIICIITAIKMLLIRRKKDIAILRMFCVSLADIKIATLLEFIIWIIPSIILGAILSLPISNNILIYKGIMDEFNTFNSLIIISKGIIINLLVFIIICIILVNKLGRIKPLDLVREDKNT